MLAEKTQQNPIEEIIKQCLDEADGDAKKACELLAFRIAADDELFESIAMPLIVRSARAHIKKWTQPKQRRRRYQDDEETGASVYSVPSIPTGMLAVASRNWLEYPLMNGLTLGDATRETVLTVSDMHAKQSRQHSARARMFKAVADRMPEGKRVRDVMSHEEIHRISLQTA